MCRCWRVPCDVLSRACHVAVTLSWGCHTACHVQSFLGVRLAVFVCSRCRETERKTKRYVTEEAEAAFLQVVRGDRLFFVASVFVRRRPVNAAEA